MWKLQRFLHHQDSLVTVLPGDVNECQSFCFVLEMCSKSEVCGKKQPSVAAQRSCLPIFEMVHGL